MRQEAEHGALDIHALPTYVLGTMARLCAPIRDEQVRGLQSLTDPAQLLREIFWVLGLMKMDMLTFTVQSLCTHLQDHTIQYERKKFQELLDKLPESLDRTREWLCKAAAEVSVPSLQPPPHATVGGSAAAHSPGAASSSATVPRLRCEEALEDVSDQVLQEASRTLSQLGYPAFTTDKCPSLKGQIKSIVDKGNAVRHVIEQRIRSFLSLFISPDAQNSQKDFPKDLDPIQEELLEVGCRFGSVIHNNRQLFGHY